MSLNNGIKISIIFPCKTAAQYIPLNLWWQIGRMILCKYLLKWLFMEQRCYVCLTYTCHFVARPCMVLNDNKTYFFTLIMWFIRFLLYPSCSFYIEEHFFCHICIVYLVMNKNNAHWIVQNLVTICSFLQCKMTLNSVKYGTSIIVFLRQYIFRQCINSLLLRKPNVRHIHKIPPVNPTVRCLILVHISWDSLTCYPPVNSST